MKVIKPNNARDPRMEVAYKSKNGIKFYTFRNPEEFPAMRGLAAERAKRFAAMNLTEQELRGLLDACIEAANRNDLVKAFAIIHEVKYRLDFICEENSLLDLACLYYVLEDEDPDNPDADSNAKKLAYMRGDAEARAFFLHMAFSIMNRYGKRRSEELLGYISETQHLAQRAHRFLPQTQTVSS
jgi:hypothetical protein